MSAEHDTGRKQHGSADDWFCVFAGLCLISVIFTAPRGLLWVALIGIGFLVMGLLGAWPGLTSMRKDPPPDQPPD